MPVYLYNTHFTSAFFIFIYPRKGILLWLKLGY
nr:MAG TPA: hypothetical protein [Caudoviricetes sp.]